MARRSASGYGLLGDPGNRRAWCANPTRSVSRSTASNLSGEPLSKNVINSTFSRNPIKVPFCTQPRQLSLMPPLGGDAVPSTHLPTGFWDAPAKERIGDRFPAKRHAWQHAIVFRESVRMALTTDDRPGARTGEPYNL